MTACCPELRADQQILVDWIQPRSRVLDLGCGDGTLLRCLMKQKQVSGYGIDFEDERILASMAHVVPVIQADIEHGLSEYFDDDSFDYVIMSQTLQALSRPDQTLLEMVRVGRQAIVAFPNFGNWDNRAQLLFKGRMPMTETLPHQWFNTPNIHLCTVRDFELLCRRLGLRVLELAVLNERLHRDLASRLAPNLLGEVALFRVERLPSA